jgi:hypothetical protein
VDARSRKYPKILISRRRGGLFKHQNNSLFDLEQTTSSAAAKEGDHFLTAAATPPQLRRRLCLPQHRQQPATPKTIKDAFMNQREVTEIAEALQRAAEEKLGHERAEALRADLQIMAKELHSLDSHTVGYEDEP